MNRECENNQLSRQPIQAAGIVYVDMVNRTRLSFLTHMVILIAK